MEYYATGIPEQAHAIMTQYRIDAWRNYDDRLSYTNMYMNSHGLALHWAHLFRHNRLSSFRLGQLRLHERFNHGLCMK